MYARRRTRPSRGTTFPLAEKMVLSRPTNSRANLFRLQPWRAFACGLGVFDQTKDAARQRSLKPTPGGNLDDRALKKIDLGATAALQIIIHRRARLRIDLHDASQDQREQGVGQPQEMRNPA